MVQLRHVCFSEDLCKAREPHFQAEQTETGNLHVIIEVEPSEKPSQYASYPQSKPQSNDYETGTQYSVRTALLSCPRATSIYKNVAVAPTILKDGNVRVAIVWQTTYLEKPVSELYVYEIPETVYYRSRQFNQDISGKVSATTKDLSEGAIPRPHRLVQGKRVMSLGQHMGGVHPASPLYQRASPQEIAVGGLQFPHTIGNQESYPRSVQYQKCFVWGLATSEGECTQISFKVVDFSFADPQRLHSITAYGVRGWQQEGQKRQNIELDSPDCACALHDDGFRLILPDTTIVEASKPAPRRETKSESASSWLQNTASPTDGLSLTRIASYLWPWKSASVQARDGAQNVGSVSRDDSSARRAALERRQEWLRGRISGMKREGLTDFEVAELWNISRWTRYGQIRKPEGWRSLGAAAEGGGVVMISA